MYNRTIKDLIRDGERTYVYLSDDETGKRFLQNAEKEGFTFGDGVKPTEREYATVMAIGADGTIGYVGAIGFTAFASGAAKIGKDFLVRIDYRKYICGEEGYSIKDARSALHAD